MKTMTLLLLASLASAQLPPMPDQPPQTDLPLVHVRSGKEAQVKLALKLPKGWRLRPGEKFMYRISQTAGAVKVDEKTRKGFLDKPKFPITVPFTPPSGKCEVQLQVAFYYCPKAGLDQCLAFSHYYLIPMLGEETGKPARIPLSVETD